MKTTLQDPKFRRAVEFVLAHETVYKAGHWGKPGYEIWEDDPDDPGGLTKFGIDQRSHPGVDIKRLSRDAAVEIYFREYWTPVRAGELPEGVAEVTFDVAVNNGRGRAAVFLQRACVDCGVAALVVDGFIGPKTIAAAKQAGVARRMLEIRERFYRELAAEKPRMRKFLRGWLRRNEDLAELIATEDSEGHRG